MEGSFPYLLKFMELNGKRRPGGGGRGFYLWHIKEVKGAKSKVEI